MKLPSQEINNKEEVNDSSNDKKTFTEPKLSFIQPKLTKHGDATKITKQTGFFGTFVP